MDKPWGYSEKLCWWGMPSQYTTIWWSTTSTSSSNDSPSAQSTNDCSSSLVTNEDDGTINSVRIDNQCYIRKTVGKGVMTKVANLITFINLVKISLGIRSWQTKPYYTKKTVQLIYNESDNNQSTKVKRLADKNIQMIVI